MPYVLRSPDGLLLSLHLEAPGQEPEWLDDDHPEVRAFVGGDSAAEKATAAASFTQMDASFVRVLEDVIDTLIIKNVINITDLPIEAQTKLLSRKSFRDRVSSQSLRLFGDPGGDGGIML
ncbi:hypothetical protein [Amphibiibacter pelophylacis]|uniref:Uncharacterized protein n=1 Tax=Amphibiibacter pelophylacis TaxID=1799477 RepID=A0ACC6NY35_9BURK